MPEPYPMPLARQRHTRALVHCLVALQLAQPFVTSARAAELTPVTAGVSLDQAANGVPIVNIATPNAAGISHNQYASFNVGSEGLILNNSAQPVSTQLGGYITGNARLGAGSARLILNEVTTASPSQLNGYMEVAGQRAGVVVANPWGISCNGCGFINTSQATLATGIPLWNSDGSLQGYRVEDGRLRFDGSGLNAGNVDGLALYTRVLELNAELYARDLSVVTGANTIDAGTGVATSLAAGGTPSMYAIDSSALGGMYADTIRLVGTEAGVGMRLAAPVAALTGALEVRNNGDVRLVRTSAQTDLVVNAAGGIALTEQAAAGHDVRLQADDTLVLADGGLLAGETLTLTAATVSTGIGSEIAARGDLSVAAQVQDYAGTTGSAGTLVLTGGTLSNAQQLAAGTGLSITADTLRNSGSVSTGAGAFALTLTGQLDNRSGLLQATDDLMITASGLANSGGSLQAGGDLTLHLPAFEHAASAGVLAAGGLLSLLTSGDIVLNGDGLATAGGLRLDAGAATIRIDTRVEAGADSELRGGYLALGDMAMAATQGALTVVADNVDNLGILYGRDSLTLQVRNVLNNGESGVRRHASLLSGGDLRITNEVGGNLVALNNYGSQIESLTGDLTLRADTLVNRNLGWSTLTYELNPLYSYDPGPTSWYWDTYYGAGISSLSYHMAYRHIATTTMNDVADGGARGSIVAGGNIDIRAGRLTNDRSTISAAGTVEVLADVLENLGTTLTDVTLVRTDRRWHVCNKHSNGNTTCNNGQAYVGTDAVLGETLEYIPAIIEGAAGAVIQADVYNCAPAGAVMPDGGCDTRDPTGTLTAPLGPWASLPTAAPGLSVGGIDPSLLPGFNLPGGGLFQLVTTPGHPFLVETDPALNTYQGFLGSAYLLAHLEDWAPDITQKRLGDGYYEIMLVREALLASIGTRFLDLAIADEREQFQYLMDNAVAASASLRLSPGIALSREQIDALQADIVWMEERVIAGQQVLVPVVYLAQGSSRLLQDGAVIGGGSLVIKGDTLMNTGLLTAAGDAALSTERTLANLSGDIRAGGQLTVQAGGDLVNESGRIQGDEVSMLVQGDFIHRTYTATNRQASGSDSYWTTQVGRRAEIAATNSLDIVAGGNVALSAARLTGGSVDVLAGGIVLLEAAKLEQGYRFTSADWQAAEEHVRYLQSEVEAVQELRLVAVGDVTAIAAALRAGGSATLEAGGSISLLAAAESDHTETHSQHDGRLKDSSSDLVHDESRILGSSIAAGGNLALTAHQGDITLYASTATAGEAANVTAGGAINLIAGVDTVSHSEQRNEETAATFKNHSEGYVRQDAVASRIASGGDLRLITTGDVNVVASELASGATLRIGDVRVDPSTLTILPLTGSEISAVRPLNLNVTTLALTNTSWNETQKGFTGPMEELVRIASAGTALFLNSYALGQIELPELSIGSHESTRTQEILQASSSFSAQDMAIAVQERAAFIGAHLEAPGTIGVSARDIVIDAAAESLDYQHQAGSDSVQGLGADFDRAEGEVRVGGVQETRTSVSDQQRVVEWKGSTINAGNLILQATNDIEVLGSELEAVGNAVLAAGGDVTIGGREGSVDSTHQEKTEVITVAAAVRNAYHDAVQAIEAVSDAKRARQAAKDALEEAERKVGLGQLAAEDVDFFRVNLAAAEVNLAQAVIGAAGSLAAAATTAASTAGTGFYATGSASHDTITTTSTTAQTTWQGSKLGVGGSALLTAGDTMAVQGSEVATAGVLALEADTIAITAGAEHFAQDSKTTESHENVGISATPTTVSANVGLSRRETDADSSATHHVNSQVSAGTLVSRSDVLRVIGAQVVAEDVDIDARELIVASLQDESRSQSETRGGSVGMSFGYGAGSAMSPTSVSGGVEQSESASDSRWVSEQTRIIGTNSIRVRATDTVLTGAVIANAGMAADGQLVDKGNLDFVTETLAVNDLQDCQHSKTTGFNFSTTLNTTAFRPEVSGEARGQTTLGGQYFGHETEQATRATLGLGKIVVGGQELTAENAGDLGLSGLNRDLGLAQEITRDQDIGGLNASVSIDNRWFTDKGPAEIVDDLLSAPENAKKVIAGASRDALRTTLTHSAYEVMFTKDAKMYVLLYDEDGNVLKDEETQMPLRREITDEEKGNLVRSSDGKVYIANNGINNDQDGAAKYASQHGISENIDGEVRIVQHFVEFQKADNAIAELLVAFYQKNLEGDFWGLTNPTKEVKDVMLGYGRTGLHLDGHSRGSMTIGNAMRSLLDDDNSGGQLGNTTISFFGPAFNVYTADELLANLQDRDSYSDGEQQSMTLQFQNHKFDPVGLFVGWNPSSGGVLPEDESVVGQMARALSGKTFTTHNCYGNGDKLCGRLWMGGAPQLVPVGDK